MTCLRVQVIGRRKPEIRYERVDDVRDDAAIRADVEAARMVVGQIGRQAFGPTARVPMRQIAPPKTDRMLAAPARSEMTVSSPDPSGSQRRRPMPLPAPVELAAGAAVYREQNDRVRTVAAIDPTAATNLPSGDQSGATNENAAEISRRQDPLRAPPAAATTMCVRCRRRAGTRTRVHRARN